MKNKLKSALLKKNKSRPPVWFMRQAGRYHQHYQKLRQKYSFMDICKRPEIACEAAMGPIQDFDFDAAILFSDILFPLEAMGMCLSFQDAPQLGWHLEKPSDLKRLKGGAQLAEGLQFQYRAIELLKKNLPSEKDLLGFVGGPLTLYCYAVEGRHKGGLQSARAGLDDGRFTGFCETLMDLIVENMVQQASAGADAIAVLDTCAGEFDPVTYREKITPGIGVLFDRFKQRCPDTPVVYYSKGTGVEHWKGLEKFPIQCLGVDWFQDLPEVLSKETKWAFQGNVDPNWLLLQPAELEQKLTLYFSRLKGVSLEGWICGLGHGILPQTPENNVRLFIKILRDFFNEV